MRFFFCEGMDTSIGMLECISDAKNSVISVRLLFLPLLFLYPESLLSVSLSYTHTHTPLLTLLAARVLAALL